MPLFLIKEEKLQQHHFLSAWAHCVKSVRIRSYSASHFIMRTRITPNADTFYAVALNTLVLLTQRKAR